MVSKRQNNFAFVCMGFIIGFVGGYKYAYRRQKIHKIHKMVEGQDISSASKKIEPEPKITYSQQVNSEKYFSTSFRHTYATLDELAKKKTDKVKSENNLTLRQKYALMEDYSYIISLSYSQACRIVSNKGYTLRVVSVQGSSQPIPSKSFSSNTFGVEIRDPNYDFQANTPSKDAVIVSINMVGPDDRQ